MSVCCSNITMYTLLSPPPQNEYTYPSCFLAVSITAPYVSWSRKARRAKAQGNTKRDMPQEPVFTAKVRTMCITSYYHETPK